MIYIFPTDTCFGIACPFSDKKNYHKIYKIKKRSMSKPLAILVKNFEWLQENTDLTPQQIDFLKASEKPFTVVAGCPHIKVYLGFEDDEGMFENKDIYELIGFRVAHNDIQDDLIRSHGPLWLTSANVSDKPELYDTDDIHEQFQYYLEKDIIEVIGNETLDCDVKPSDVFGFKGDSLEQVFYRQN